MRTSSQGWAREDVEDGLPDGWHCWLRRRTWDSFFSSRGLEAAGLEEGVSDHCHQGVSMQSRPGSAFEVIETKFLLELLVCLFTDPTGLDRSRERLERDIRRKVRDVILLLAGRAALADEPDFLARHALRAIIEHPVLVAICNPDAGCGEEAGQPSLDALPPAYLFSSANITSAETGRQSGMWYWLGRPPFATGKIKATLAG